MFAKRRRGAARGDRRIGAGGAPDHGVAGDIFEELAAATARRGAVGTRISEGGPSTPRPERVTEDLRPLMRRRSLRAPAVGAQHHPQRCAGTSRLPQVACFDPTYIARSRRWRSGSRFPQRSSMPVRALLLRLPRAVGWNLRRESLASRRCAAPSSPTSATAPDGRGPRRPLGRPPWPSRRPRGSWARASGDLDPGMVSTCRPRRLRTRDAWSSSIIHEAGCGALADQPRHAAGRAARPRCPSALAVAPSATRRQSGWGALAARARWHDARVFTGGIRRARRLRCGSASVGTSANLRSRAR